jgi:hypothetical protein
MKWIETVVMKICYKIKKMYPSKGTENLLKYQMAAKTNDVREYLHPLTRQESRSLFRPIPSFVDSY